MCPELSLVSVTIVRLAALWNLCWCWLELGLIFSQPGAREVHPLCAPKVF